MMKEKHKVFIPCCCCCCCPSDPMHLVARVPVTGYTPGQTINIEIDVDNKSEETADFAVQLMKVSWLTQNWKWHIYWWNMMRVLVFICSKSRITHTQAANEPRWKPLKWPKKSMWDCHKWIHSKRFGWPWLYRRYRRQTRLLATFAKCDICSE